MCVRVDAPLCYANAIRRALLTRVDCLAFDYVTIHENTTCMPNELIAHRVGMIPVIGRGSVHSAVADGEDRTFRNCAVFKLNVERRDADSADLVCDDACSVPPAIQIAPMRDTQVLRLTAEATLNSGLAHGRWNCAVAARCVADDDGFDIRFESTGAVPRRKMLDDALQGLVESVAAMRRNIVNQVGVVTP